MAPRRDGQLTTQQLIPELFQVNNFFPKGPPPGPPPPGAPGGPPPAAPTHPPRVDDRNWIVPSIGCNSTKGNVFYLQIGPAAGKKGNQGLGAYGQAWYVNGELAPDIQLVRGEKYTFIVEGGLGTDQDGIIHPFYLTSDMEGGYGTKSDYEARMEEVFGGLKTDRDGLPNPAIMGRLCRWKTSRASATFANYQDFKAQLKLKCQETGSPGILRFRPDFDMPSDMYYQSFSEKFLGGKIKLLDACMPDIYKTGSQKKESPKKTKNQGTSKQKYYQSNVPKRQNTERFPEAIKKFSDAEMHMEDTFSRTKPNRVKKTRRPLVSQKKPDTRVKTEKPKEKKKCSKKPKLDKNGMPKFEHFPVKEILKTGVGSDEEECTDSGFDDWGMDPYNNYGNDYDYDSDYVQTTRKPLIFKQLFNKAPLNPPDLNNIPQSPSYANYPPTTTDSYFSKPKKPSRVNPVSINSGLRTGQLGFPDHKEKPILSQTKPRYQSQYNQEEAYQYIDSNNKPPKDRHDLDNFPGKWKERDDVPRRPQQPFIQQNKKKQPESAPEVLPAPLPPPSNFPSFFNIHERKKESQKSPNPPKREQEKDVKRPSHPPPTKSIPKRLPPAQPPFPAGPPVRRNPIHDLINPFKHMWQKPRHPPQNKHPNTPRIDGNVRSPPLDRLPRPHGPPPRRREGPHRDGPPPPRRREGTNISQLPAPLPPPANFPPFDTAPARKQFPRGDSEKNERKRPMEKERENYNDKENERGDRRPQRRKKRPRRPLFEDPSKTRDKSVKRPESVNPATSAKKVKTNASPDQQMPRNKASLPRYPPYGSNNPAYERYPSQPEISFAANRRPQQQKRNKHRPKKNSYNNYFDQYNLPSERVESNTLAPIDTMPGVFNPHGIKAESGFTPILPVSGNLPTLAFSIYDSNQSGYDSNQSGGMSGNNGGGSYFGQEGNNAMDRMDLYNGYTSYDRMGEQEGDRGNVVVDIPAPVLPYVPRQRSIDILPEERLYNRRNTIPSRMDKEEEGNSADFHSFETVGGDRQMTRVQNVVVPPGDGPMLLSVGSSMALGPTKENKATMAVGSVGEPEFAFDHMLARPLADQNGDIGPAYGSHHSSFVPPEYQTAVDGGGVKVLNTGQDVVYGRTNETPSAPMQALYNKNVDKRFLDKLKLLEEESKDDMKKVMTDLWSIMKQNGEG